VLAVVLGWNTATAPEVQAHVPPPPPRDIYFRASLDESQVVRPPQEQPPKFGTGSASTGELSLVVNTGSNSLALDNSFALDLEIEGIFPEDLDDSHGPNRTAIHIRGATVDSLGPVILDVHEYAREDLPETNGVTATPNGFRLHAEGTISETQGLLDTSVTLLEILDFLRSERAYITVYTRTNSLFRDGEIRGNLQVVPVKIRFAASLDEGQVVRPPEFRPPSSGTGSAGIGEASLALNTVTNRFSFDLEVEGIDPEALDDSHGANLTAIHIYQGSPDSVGPLILDVHHFARQGAPATDGVESTDGGFRLHAEGHVAQLQGSLDTGFSAPQIIDFLRRDQSYVTVRTMTEPLLREGEIRGTLTRLPNEIRVRATLDEGQVVRPVAFRPPTLGTGSAASGDAQLVVDTDTGKFSFQLSVDGMDPANFDNRHTENDTAVHLHWGPPGLEGPIIVDLHHFARQALPATDGVTAADGGFLMRADDYITRVQGGYETSFTFHQILDFLTSGQAYLVVKTSTEPLFRSGEIRGDVELIPRQGVSQELHLTASLDESQVALPPEFQPPEFGTGSTSVGEARLSANLQTSEFSLDLDVTGIDPADFDFSQGEHGANHTAIHVYHGGPDVRGPILLDVHYFARQLLPPEMDGVTVTPQGFRMHAEGRMARTQGLHDTGFSAHEITEAFLCEEAYIAIHTVTNPVFKSGEIRGNLTLLPERRFQRGDGNADGRVNISDAIFIVDHLFVAGAQPTCMKTADANDDGIVNISDPIFLVAALFQGGPQPATPSGECGVDATSDPLSCAAFSPCE
jgi:hypothetical protein